jgi:hypothetical protein
MPNRSETTDYGGQPEALGYRVLSGGPIPLKVKHQKTAKISEAAQWSFEGAHTCSLAETTITARGDF